MANTTPLPDDCDKETLLRLFEVNERSTAFSAILAVIRQGLLTVESVFDRLRVDLATDENPTRQKLRILSFNSPGSVKAGIRYAIAWESLPHAEKARYKRAREVGALDRWRQTVVPTEPQLEYLRHLGWTGVRPGTRAVASALIDRLRGGRR